MHVNEACTNTGYFSPWKVIPIKTEFVPIQLYWLSTFSPQVRESGLE